MRIVTHYFSVTRGGLSNTLTNLAAYVYPAGANITAFIDIPASKAFSIIFDGSPDLKEQDMLVGQAAND